MKKLILAALAVGSFSTVYAQKPGSVLIYGNIGLDSKKDVFNPGFAGAPDAETTNTKFNLSLGAGYQFSKYLTAGINAGMGTSKLVVPGGAEGLSNSFHAGAFLRHTVALNKTFYLFDQLNLGYYGSIDKEKSATGTLTDHYNTHGFYANLTPAVGINITPCLALNFSIGGIQYTNDKSTNQISTAGVKDYTKTSQFQLTLGQQVNVGISANIGGKKYSKKHRHAEPKHHHRIDLNDTDESED